MIVMYFTAAMSFENCWFVVGKVWGGGFPLLSTLPQHNKTFTLNYCSIFRKYVTLYIGRLHAYACLSAAHLSVNFNVFYSKQRRALKSVVL